MKYKNSRPRTPAVCPVCDEPVPPGALACPECGADHNSGWKEDALEEEESFDYQEFVEREFGDKRRRAGIHPIWWITAVVLLAALLWYVFAGL